VISPPSKQRVVLGILPFSERFELTWRSVRLLDARASSASTSRSSRRADPTRDGQRTGLLGGVGFGITFADALHVRFEVQSTNDRRGIAQRPRRFERGPIAARGAVPFGAGKASVSRPEPRPYALRR